MSRPTSALVTELASGAVLVQGYPTGPTMCIGPGRADALRAALAVLADTEPADPAYSRIAAPPIVRPRVWE